MVAEICYIYRATTVIVNEPTPTIDTETDPSCTDKAPEVPLRIVRRELGFVLLEMIAVYAESSIDHNGDHQ
jgi:hypothetical protein